MVGCKQEEEVVARFTLLNAKEDKEAREAVDNAEEIHSTSSKYSRGITLKRSTFKKGLLTK